MPPPPNPKVLFSLPFSFVIIALVVLGLLVAAGGWILARRRRPALPSLAPTDIPWLPTMLEALPCGALLAGVHGRVILANGRARRWLGEAGHSRRLPQAIQALVGRVIATGVSEGLETHAPSSKDRRLWIEATALRGSGEVLVLIEERAGEGGGVATEVYRRLMRTIAHELRTPLTAIMGHADILSSCSIEEEPLWRRSQQFITSEAERLARLVEDLLTLSRLDLTPSTTVPVNVQAAAEEALSALWESAEEKGVTLTLQAVSGLPRVAGDADRLRQVFINLLDNGVKYTPPGGRVTVRLTQKKDRDRVQAEVSDTGMGIPQTDIPHIFDPLFRSEEARRAASGTGLGLTIVRTILAQHGAEVRVHSELETGTTFSFDLPIAT